MNKIVVGNQKTYMTKDDINIFLDKFKCDSKDVIICPTSIYIPYYLEKGFKVGVQNIGLNSKGANTGEITAKQVLDMGLEYTIVGHSEIREHQKETDKQINQKIEEALKNNLKVILCVGETKEQRDMLKTNVILKRQITNDLRNIKDIGNVIIAYEPIWAIGTNEIPTNKEIKTTIEYIKELVLNSFKTDVKVLYGGSVNENNIKQINKIKNLDGVLVGKCSSNAVRFKSIIEVVVDQ